MVKTYRGEPGDPLGRNRCVKCGTSLVGTPDTVRKLCSSCAYRRGRELARLAFQTLREMSDVGVGIVSMDLRAPMSTSFVEGSMDRHVAPSGPSEVEVTATIRLEPDQMVLDDGSNVQAAIDDMGPERPLSDVVHDTQYHPAVREALKRRRIDPPAEVLALMQEVAQVMEERTEALLDRMARAAVASKEED